MIIETKFDVGDEVWAHVHTNNPDHPWILLNTKIHSIEISVVDEDDHFVEAYYANKKIGNYLFWPHMTFKTKEDAEAYWERIQ